MDRIHGGLPCQWRKSFCYHIQQDEQKHRTIMHINSKLGEQVEVYWAGDFATVINSNTDEIIKSHIFVRVMICSQYTYVEVFRIWSGNQGLMLMSICTSIWAVLPRFTYRITARLQLFTMMDEKDCKSMELIRRWLGTMALLLLWHTSELPRISRMLKER